MRTKGWGITALALLTGAAVATAQPPKGKGMPEGWWNNLFSFSKPKEEAKKPTPPAPSQQDKSRELERIQRAFERREAVCTRLSEIGQAQQDEKLIEEADRLFELACQVYQEQAARVMGTRSRTLEQDEAELTRPMGRDRTEQRIGQGQGGWPGGAGAGSSERSRTGEGWR